jgi:transposase InsO family protein
MRLEENLPVKLVCSEAGVHQTSLSKWVRLYRQYGESGLASSPHSARSEVHPAIAEKILAIKREHPGFGVRRIVASLRRWFLLPASSGTVSTTLSQAGLSGPAPRSRQRNVQKPRRFERSTPNQMWQSDIMMFRMGGRQVYLIGFIDDYSRYIVGLSLCMAQTADNVLELYRKATAEYGVPKEMLTDNGRQYVNWRGTSKFQAELHKDRVKHIRSSPHHPMTLGKIERFWKTIFEEFLAKAQFESFENAQERVRLWTQYYNHKRPHQGIESLCPADRFFEIAGEVRKTIEAGVRENTLELALRGKPKEPFYLVGRMDGQAVVLRAQKGRLKLTIDDALKPSQQEHEFTIDKEKQDEHGEQSAEQSPSPESFPAQAPHAFDGNGSAEGRSGVEGMGGTEHAVAGVSRDEHYMDYIEPLAEACDGGDAAGAGAACAVGQGACAESAPAGAFEKAVVLSTGEIAVQAAAIGAEELNGRLIDGGCRQGEGASISCDECAVRANECHGGGGNAGDIAQELLRVAGPGACRDAGCADGPACRQEANTGGCGEGATQGAGGDALHEIGAGAEDDRGEKYSGRLRSAAEVALERFREAG